MAQIQKLVAQMRDNPKNVRFNDLVKVCNHYFGSPRQQGTSHCVYKTPWMGDPRVKTRAFLSGLKIRRVAPQYPKQKRKSQALSSQTGFKCDRKTGTAKQ